MSQHELFRYPVLIKEHHLDTFGHVNNATYLELLEEARWEFVSARGFGLGAIHKMGVGPTILSWQIKFIKELRLRQNIVIESQMIAYEKKIGTLRQDIFNEQEELCSQAVMTFGLFSLTERKLILPMPEWLHAVGIRTA